MDIRGFFGGKPPAKAAPAEKKEPSPSKKRPVNADDEVLLNDSDEDQRSNVRSRLKKASKSSPEATKPVVPVVKKSSPSPAKNGGGGGVISLIDCDSDDGNAVTKVVSAPPVKPSPAKQKLKPLEDPASVKTVGVAADAASFFGSSKPAAAASPQKKAVLPDKAPSPAPAAAVPSAEMQAYTAMKASPPPASMSAKRPLSAISDGSSDQCLADLKIAVTGLFRGMSREGVEDRIKELGGKIAGAVSGKTDYLVHGYELEDGRAVETSKKYREAREKGVKVLSEEQFLALIQERGQDEGKKLRASPAKAPVVPAAKPAAALTAPKAPSLPPTSSAAAKASNTSNATKSGAVEEMMWVDKYKPSRIEHIIASSETVNKLQAWLARWDKVHLLKVEKPPQGGKENPGAKAVLLSGPPGIGKTTVATLVSHHLGYETYELNASDTRSKRAVTEQVADVTCSRALDSSGGMRKRVVIMDEVDGMGGSDRGGIPELIKVIKASKTPIICICNDRQSQKIRSLVNHCFDIRVKRPQKEQIAKRLVEIGRLEGMDVELNAATLLLEQVGNDIRQALHTMQMWHAQSSTLRYGELKAGMSRIEKDQVLRHSPFDACMQILGGTKTDLSERYNSFFIDYSLIPLMVQENYLVAAKANSARMDEVRMMDILASAADAVADMELAGSSLRGQDQHWELLPAQAMFTVRVGSIVQGFLGFPTFPSWLGKYSTTGKKARLTNELVYHTNLIIGQGFSSMRLEYAPYLKNLLLDPLMRNGKDGIAETCALLDAYGLSKDDFTENLRELQFLLDKDKVLVDRITAMDSQTKAALTRAYNSTDHKAQALVGEQAIGKKKGRARASYDDAGLGTTEELDAAREDSEEEKEETEILDVAKFAKAQRKGKSGSSSSSAKPKAPAKPKAKAATKK